MAIFNQAMALLDRLVPFIAWLKKQDEAKKASLRLAIDSLRTAVAATQVYVAGLERGEAVDRSREINLNQLWGNASMAFYGVDGDLADRLQLKSEHWAQPELWSHDQIRSANISLQQIAEYVRQLLREG